MFLWPFAPTLLLLNRNFKSDQLVIKDIMHQMPTIIMPDGRTANKLFQHDFDNYFIFVPCKTRISLLSKHAHWFSRKANVGLPPGHGQQHFGMSLAGASAPNSSHSSAIEAVNGSHFDDGISKESLPFQTRSFGPEFLVIT